MGAMEGFKSYNVFMFEMLRDATSKKAASSTEDASMETSVEPQQAAEPSTEPQPAAAEPSAEPQPVEEAILDSKAASEEPASKIPEQAHAGVVEAMAVLGA